MSGTLKSAHDEAKRRGDALIKEAESRKATWTPFGFGRSAVDAEAAEKFKMAGNQYKLGNCFEEAGNAYLKASENFKKSDEKLEATNSVVEAAQCYKKDPLCLEKAISTFQLAIEDYNMAGRFSRSCQYLKEIAEIYETSENWENAAQAYEQLASMYSSDNKSSQELGILTKMAGIMCEKLELYREAATIYKQLGTKAMESNLGKFSAKGHLMLYLLCLNALGDCVALSEGVETCKSIDYSFGNSRECEFITKLVKAVEENDEAEYATACAEFDNITPLDSMKTTLLLKGRKSIQCITLDETGGEYGNDDDDHDHSDLL
jgi:alpha-soluble NSF attachment protein